jgi:hypothetical protein
VSEEQAHRVTLRLLKEVAEELPGGRREEVIEQHDLIARLLDVGVETSCQDVAQELLRDALSI